MSLPIFNSPPSMAWNSTKTQIWDTKIQKYGSGRRKTLSRWPYPQWEIDCDYTCLDRDELEYTAGFFAKVRGQFQPFLWKDDQDYKQTGVQIGIGNGSTTGFQLIRNYGGFVEPVLDIVAGTLTAYENDVAKTVTLGEDGWIEFSTAPASGALITASFEYYWRVAFAKDEKTWENFWYDFYRLKSIKLVTVK